MQQAPHPALSVNTPLYPPAGRYAFVAARVAGIEGGHANIAADHGGETNFGISLRFLKLEGRLDLDGDGHADFDLDFDGDIDGHDIRLLTPQQALNLFYYCIWQRYDIGGLPKFIDSAVFDQAVNGGMAAATKLLQSSLNRMVLTSADLKVDGVLGNETRARVGMALRQAHGVETLIHNYRQAAEARYNAIVRADHSQVIFLDGWVKRARQLGSV